MVVEEVQGLHVGVISEPPVGEVGLPAFVELVGGEADVGRFGAFLRGGGDQPGGGEVAVDCADRDGGRRGAMVASGSRPGARTRHRPRRRSG